MGTDEKIAILARAILALAERSAHTWDYDGETMVGEGVQLPFDIEETLRALSDQVTRQGEESGR